MSAIVTVLKTLLALGSVLTLLAIVAILNGITNR